MVSEDDVVVAVDLMVDRKFIIVDHIIFCNGVVIGQV